MVPVGEKSDVIFGPKNPCVELEVSFFAGACAVPQQMSQSKSKQPGKPSELSKPWKPN